MNYTLYLTINFVLSILEIVILIRVISSWLPLNRDNKLMAYIYRITEPLMAPIRQMLARTPIGGGMIDFSPIVVFLLISIVRRLINGMLF
jgi:YggT family protein